MDKSWGPDSRLSCWPIAPGAPYAFFFPCGQTPPAGQGVRWGGTETGRAYPGAVSLSEILKSWRETSRSWVPALFLSPTSPVGVASPAASLSPRPGPVLLSVPPGTGEAPRGAAGGRERGCLAGRPRSRDYVSQGSAARPRPLSASAAGWSPRLQMSGARAGGGAAGAAPPGPGRRPAHYARPGGWRWKVRASRPLPAAPGVPPLSPPPGTHLRRGGAALARPSPAGQRRPPAGPLCRPLPRPRRGASPAPAHLGPPARSAAAALGQVPWSRAAAAAPALGGVRGRGCPEASLGNFPPGPEVPPLPARAADLRRLSPERPRPRAQPGRLPRPAAGRSPAGAEAPPSLAAVQIPEVPPDRDAHEDPACPAWAQSCARPLLPWERWRNERAEMLSSWAAGSCEVFTRCPAPGEVPR